MSHPDLYALIDHTQLAPEATAADIDSACDIAAQFRCATVCVRPEWVAHANSRLTGSRRIDGSPVGVTTVIDFPYGGASLDAKVSETLRSIHDGATEIDLVMDLEAATIGDWVKVAAGIAAVRDASLGTVLKVIIESAGLADADIVKACHVAVDGGADYVKTSTGYSHAGGATTHAVALMSDTVPAGIGIKASGGLRTREDILGMIAAGATRIGTSATATLALPDASSDVYVNAY